ncbi:hypothetical protein K491DRAFT_407589 [Lophiostoma macrostomum CBS 122681]|uniref:Uncharacterized protein n=1 Tax=Lophiostoma macrostomum CBS 122681 TaxID=1314788 RepID=A0A6A6T7A0_9PLEO|nr:hypothetical protein K491DRAFT_407589 [Lophiostoma macrostomum CBS 122681]
MVFCEPQMFKVSGLVIAKSPICKPRASALASLRISSCSLPDLLAPPLITLLTPPMHNPFLTSYPPISPSYPNPNPPIPDPQNRHPTPPKYPSYHRRRIPKHIHRMPNQRQRLPRPKEVEHDECPARCLDSQ